MWNTITETATGYWVFYGQYFQQQWHHMTPMKYGTLLISIGVFGWILMKNGSKR